MFAFIRAHFHAFALLLSWPFENEFFVYNNRQVAFSAATERAFTGRTVDGLSHDNKQSGVYVGAVSGLPLFRSDQKYDSGTGWPSFFAPFDDSHVVEVPEGLGFLSRIEIVDARSGAHLGHGEALCNTSVGY